MKKIIKIMLTIITLLTIACQQNKKANILNKKSNTIHQLNFQCIQVYNAIKKYSKQYNIPSKFLYGIVYKESRYKGKYDYNYKSGLISSYGALGPMQVIPCAAQWTWDSTIDNTILKTNIAFNIETSAKLLQKLSCKCDSWIELFSIYNTGKKAMTKYAFDVYNFDTTKYWIKHD